VRRFRRHTEDSFVIELNDGLLLVVPAWMLDAAVCSGMRVEARPRIAVSALLDLCRMLDALPMFAQERLAASVDSTSKGGLPDASVETPSAASTSKTSIRGRKSGRAVESIESKATRTVPESDQPTPATNREPTRQRNPARRKEQP
jgi:hypothetical protein